MNKLADIWKFLTYDIWRITEHEVTKTKFSIYNIIKTIYLCIDRFNKERLTNKASALTYSTLLALVPILAILFAIARGFGFANLMEHEVRTGLAGHSEATEIILSFVDSYLAQTKSGVFIGVGVVMLLWTVINLIGNIEVTFNRIWQVKKGRSMYRKVTDYFSMLLVMPILIILSSGFSIFTTTMLKGMEEFALLAPILKFLIRMIPFVITWMMFMGLYIFMPNTKVKFKHAMISGIIAGTAYQLFQMLYISGQMWVSKYNAIYGSFAALPLLLLWLQVSWTICLIGAELTYAGQNVKNFSFDKDTRNISNRYKNFVSILVMSLIAKRFEKNEPPYTAEQISEIHTIPLRLTKKTLYQLQEVELIHEVVTDEKSEHLCYQPSVDIHQLDVAMLLDRLSTFGSEDFKVDKDGEFQPQWKVLTDLQAEYYASEHNVLVKDL